MSFGIVPVSEEDRAKLALLHLPVGEPGSGLQRYAAAMYFFQRGMLSEDILEVYRAFAKLDHEDPTHECPR